jgi:hypothetical protein
MIILKDNQTIRNSKIITIGDKSIKKVSAKAKKKTTKYFKQIKNI